MSYRLAYLLAVGILLAPTLALGGILPSTQLDRLQLSSHAERPAVVPTNKNRAYQLSQIAPPVQAEALVTTWSLSLKNRASQTFALQREREHEMAVARASKNRAAGFARSRMSRTDLGAKMTRKNFLRAPADLETEATIVQPSARIEWKNRASDRALAQAADGGHSSVTPSLAPPVTIIVDVQATPDDRPLFVSRHTVQGW
jgi:hypothetical protein